MSNSIEYTLITDGSSDKILLHVISWLLNDLYPTIPNNGTYADFSFLPKPPKKGDIKSQVKAAQEIYPYDILFFHRDAESNTKVIVQERMKEIQSELAADELDKTICVIPVKMMESWLLIDEDAIKRAAGNRNYKPKISLPAIRNIEKEKDPKTLLQNLLKTVSGKKGRNLRTFNVHQAIHLVADNIEDYSLLRELKSFQMFEAELKKVVDSYMNSVKTI